LRRHTICIGDACQRPRIPRFTGTVSDFFDYSRGLIFTTRAVPTEEEFAFALEIQELIVNKALVRAKELVAKATSWTPEDRNDFCRFVMNAVHLDRLLMGSFLGIFSFVEWSGLH
jgi:hypothetical protein